jgi:hypothetical protein
VAFLGQHLTTSWHACPIWGAVIADALIRGILKSLRRAPNCSREPAIASSVRRIVTHREDSCIAGDNGAFKTAAHYCAMIKANVAVALALLAIAEPEDLGIDSEKLEAVFGRAKRDVDDGALKSAKSRWRGTAGRSRLSHSSACVIILLSSLSRRVAHGVHDASATSLGALH